MTTPDDTTKNSMQLYSRTNKRLYLNATERDLFFKACKKQPLERRVFALTLFYTGCRLSEARALTPAALQFQEQILSIRSLKKRDQHHVREIPIPPDLSLLLRQMSAKTSENALYWRVDRVTAYRWIKNVMTGAGLEGPQACPKGLRHSFGVHAIQNGIQLDLLRRWMGHASLETTAIYTRVMELEEIELAKRMWHGSAS
ncbi:tyrosine-type recombinase/integrase [Algirhabdus cladophorae]|uniref:tyrosine-type recombinase/integrase n=1 Tax=Algirhabdus cladophorae TaxID=3377108 RepID=UPI003B846675